MGIDVNCLPEHFLEKLFPEERRKTLELRSRNERRREKKMHAKFEDWLRLRQITWVDSRMDRPSTIQEGHPDYTILYDNRNLMVEFKVPGGKLSPAQEERIAALRRCGNKVVVCYSWEEGIMATKQHFDL